MAFEYVKKETFYKEKNIFTKKITRRPRARPEYIYYQTIIFILNFFDGPVGDGLFWPIILIGLLAEAVGVSGAPNGVCEITLLFLCLILLLCCVVPAVCAISKDTCLRKGWDFPYVKSIKEYINNLHNKIRERLVNELINNKEFQEKFINEFNRKIKVTWEIEKEKYIFNFKNPKNENINYPIKVDCEKVHNVGFETLKQVSKSKGHNIIFDNRDFYITYIPQKKDQIILTDHTNSKTFFLFMRDFSQQGSDKEFKYKRIELNEKNNKNLIEKLHNLQINGDPKAVCLKDFPGELFGKDSVKVYKDKCDNFINIQKQNFELNSRNFIIQHLLYTERDNNGGHKLPVEFANLINNIYEKNEEQCNNAVRNCDRVTTYLLVILLIIFAVSLFIGIYIAFFLLCCYLFIPGFTMATVSAGLLTLLHATGVFCQVLNWLATTFLLIRNTIFFWSDVVVPTCEQFKKADRLNPNRSNWEKFHHWLTLFCYNTRTSQYLYKGLFLLLLVFIVIPFVRMPFAGSFHSLIFLTLSNIFTVPDFVDTSIFVTGLASTAGLAWGRSTLNILNWGYNLWYDLDPDFKRKVDGKYSAAIEKINAMHGCSSDGKTKHIANLNDSAFIHENYIDRTPLKLKLVRQVVSPDQEKNKKDIIIEISTKPKIQYLTPKNNKLSINENPEEIILNKNNKKTFEKKNINFQKKKSVWSFFGSGCNSNDEEIKLRGEKQRLLIKN